MRSEFKRSVKSTLATVWHYSCGTVNLWNGCAIIVWLFLPAFPIESRVKNRGSCYLTWSCATIAT